MAESFTVDQIEQRVRKVVTNYLQVDDETVQSGSHFVDDLGADSLDLTEIAIAFEDEFQLEIPDSDFGQLSTVQSAVDYIRRRLI